MTACRRFAPIFCLAWFFVRAACAANPPALPQLATLNGAGEYRSEHTVVTAAADVSGPILRVGFEADGGYPDVIFPAPAGHWNLSAYLGVEVGLFNSGKTPVLVGLRADNQDAKNPTPWVSEQVALAPGEHRTILVAFKPAAGVAGPVFDPAHVVSVRVYVVRPTAAGELTLSNLRASASDANSPSAERLRPVVPPSWVGKRPPVPGDWKITFDENFDGSQLDERRWSTHLSWTGFMPDWKARYSPRNVFVRDGQLILLVEKKTGPADDNPTKPTRDITSGLVCTLDKWKQAYGYFEARVKLPTAPGLWPCFWMMPDRGQGTPKRESTGNGGMEFDIIEHLTEWGPGRYNNAVHWGDYGPEHRSWANNNVYYGPTADGWHTWGMLWEPGRVTWYCDGAKKSVYEGESVGSVPAYLILNVQAGGWAKAPVDPAKMPDRMLVDYVRVWQTAERLSQKN